MEMVMNELDPREAPGSVEDLVTGCAMLDSCAEIRTPDTLYNVLTHNFIRYTEIILGKLFRLTCSLQTLRTEPRPVGPLPARGMVCQVTGHAGRAVVLAGGAAAHIRRRVRGEHEPGARLDAAAHLRRQGCQLRPLEDEVHLPGHPG